MLPANFSMSVFVDRVVSAVEQDFYALVVELVANEGLSFDVAVDRAVNLLPELVALSVEWDGHGFSIV